MNRLRLSLVLVVTSLYLFFIPSANASLIESTNNSFQMHLCQEDSSSDPGTGGDSSDVYQEPDGNSYNQGDVYDPDDPNNQKQDAVPENPQPGQNEFPEE